MQISESVSLLDSGVSTVVEESRLVALASVDVSIDTVVADVHLSVGVPSVEILVGCVDDLGRLFGPNQIFCFLSPEALFVVDGSLIDLVVDWVREIVAVLVSDVLVFSFLYSNKDEKLSYAYHCDKYLFWLSLILIIKYSEWT